MTPSETGSAGSNSVCPGAFVVQGDGPLITPTPSNTPTLPDVDARTRSRRHS